MGFGRSRSATMATLPTGEQDLRTPYFSPPGSIMKVMVSSAPSLPSTAWTATKSRAVNSFFVSISNGKDGRDAAFLPSSFFVLGRGNVQIGIAGHLLNMSEPAFPEV